MSSGLHHRSDTIENRTGKKARPRNTPSKGHKDWYVLYRKEYIGHMGFGPRRMVDCQNASHRMHMLANSLIEDFPNKHVRCCATQIRVRLAWSLLHMGDTDAAKGWPPIFGRYNSD